MTIYESAMYQGKPWCAYELKNTAGEYDEELRLFMRKESQSLAFTCPECGEKMMLCAGPIMEPYFRHYSDCDCVSRSIGGGEQTMKLRRIIYRILRDNYPEAQLEVGKKLTFSEDGIPETDAERDIQETDAERDMQEIDQESDQQEGALKNESKSTSYRPDFLVTFSNGDQLAVHYLSHEMKLSEWEQQHLIYQSVGIWDVWFLNSMYFYTKRFRTFEYLVSKYYSEVLYINYQTGMVEVKECRRLSNGAEKNLLFTCAPKEVQIDRFGHILNYTEYRNRELQEEEKRLQDEERRKREKEDHMHTVEAKVILSASNGMNIYRGCSHGCIYCDARSECYQMKHEFEDIEVKINAPQLLLQELKRKRSRVMVGTGGMSDPYMHLEEKLRLTRQCLEVIDQCDCGIAIQTKSNRILRDIDLLDKINQKTKAVVQITLTTADEELCKIVEPNVCTTAERVDVLKKMQERGIPTVVWMTPLLPWINDTVDNVCQILEACAQTGVYGIITFGFGLTLRDGDRHYYYEKLDQHFPGLKQKYINRYGLAYEIPSDNTKEIAAFFFSFCKEHHIETDVDKIFEYMRTYEDKQAGQQLSLMDFL